MDEKVRLPGSNVALAVSIVDNAAPANNPVTGLAIVVSVRRVSDDQWWNFEAFRWDIVPGGYASLTADHKGILTDRLDGSYSRCWDQAAADNSAISDYVATFEITTPGDFQGMVSHERWVFTGDTWRSWRKMKLDTATYPDYDVLEVYGLDEGTPVRKLKLTPKGGPYLLREVI
jgi:hypothetical protein